MVFHWFSTIVNGFLMRNKWFFSFSFISIGIHWFYWFARILFDFYGISYLRTPQNTRYLRVESHHSRAIAIFLPFWGCSERVPSVFRGAPRHATRTHVPPRTPPILILLQDPPSRSSFKILILLQDPPSRSSSCIFILLQNPFPTSSSSFKSSSYVP